MIDLLPSLFLLIAAGFLGAWLIEILVRKPLVGAGLISGFIVMATILRSEVIPQFRVAGFSIYLYDLAVAALGIAAFFRLWRQGTLIFAQKALIVLLLIGTLGVVRGIPIFGLAESVNEFRMNLYFLVGALYFTTVAPSRRVLEQLTPYLHTAAWVVAFMCLVLWASVLAGVALPSPLAIPPEQFRVVGADRALFLAQVFLLTIPGFTAPTSAGRSKWALALLPIVLLLQHRTVWAALILGVIVTVARARRWRARLAIAIVGISVLAVTLVLAFGGDESGSLGQALEEDSANRATFEWRIAGWADLIGQSEVWSIDGLIGQPYGSGYDRKVFGIREDVSPHNYYLEIYLRHGLIGLGLFVWVFFYAIKGLWQWGRRTSGYGLASPSVPLGLLVMQLVMFITYAAPTEQGLIAGFLLRAAADARVASGSRRSEQDDPLDLEISEVSTPLVRAGAPSGARPKALPNRRPVSSATPSAPSG